MTAFLALRTFAALFAAVVPRVGPFTLPFLAERSCPHAPPEIARRPIYGHNARKPILETAHPNR